MPILSSLFRRRTQAKGPNTEANASWRKNDFLACSVGPDTQAVMRRGENPIVVPGFLVDFINSCDRFGRLPEHIAAYASKHGWGGLEAEALNSWLPKAIEARLLVSNSEVLAECARHTAAQPPGIAAIGFPTGGERVRLVARALTSFARNVREHGRTAEYLIADSSAQPAQREAFRAAARELAREGGLRVRYAGEEEKRRFANELIRKGAPPDTVEFALFDPLGTGFACGANRNALLLHQAGSMFCSIDDDVICDLAFPPATGAKLKLFSSADPFSRWLFRDTASAIAHVDRQEADFLASHEALLGRGVAELTAGCTVDSLDLEQGGDDLLRRLHSGPGRIRASFSGHYGDPGIPTSIYYLWYEGENRGRLVADEASYRAVLASRAVFAAAPCTALGDASTSPGMAMGLDHRELLPPFFPVLHAEDFTYGATLWQTVSEAFLGHSPVAIRHEPPPGKTMLQLDDLGPDRRAVIFEFSHLIRRVILGFSRFESAAPEVRMKRLGRHLAMLGEQPLEDFAEFIRVHVLDHESGKLNHLEEQLRNDTESPDFWRADVERYIAHVRDALTFGDFDIPYDLKGDRSEVENRRLMRELFVRYGRLLEAWPEMVSAARELNARIDWMPLQ